MLPSLCNSSFKRTLNHCKLILQFYNQRHFWFCKTFCKKLWFLSFIEHIPPLPLPPSSTTVFFWFSDESEFNNFVRWRKRKKHPPDRQKGGSSTGLKPVDLLLTEQMSLHILHRSYSFPGILKNSIFPISGSFPKFEIHFRSIECDLSFPSFKCWLLQSYSMFCQLWMNTWICGGLRECIALTGQELDSRSLKEARGRVIIVVVVIFNGFSAGISAVRHFRGNRTHSNVSRHDDRNLQCLWTADNDWRRRCSGWVGGVISLNINPLI